MDKRPHRRASKFSCEKFIVTPDCVSSGRVLKLLVFRHVEVKVRMFDIYCTSITLLNDRIRATYFALKPCEYEIDLKSLDRDRFVVVHPIQLCVYAARRH